MRAFGWFIITLLLGACSADKPSKKCIYPAGELFFSKEKQGGVRYILVRTVPTRYWCTIPRNRGFVWKVLIISGDHLSEGSDTPNRIGVWEDIPWNPELVTR